jgi:hypothetical protein
MGRAAEIFPTAVGRVLTQDRGGRGLRGKEAGKARASPGRPGADYSAARGGCRRPELALSLRERQEVQDVLRRMIAKAIRV